MAPDRFALLVQAYLDDTLDDADRAELATALEQDPALVDPFLDQLVVAGGCGGGEDLARLRLRLDSASCQLDLQRLTASRRFRRPFPRWGIGVAAAAAVLLSVGLLALRPSPATGPERSLPDGLVLEGRDGHGPVRLQPGDRLTATTDIDALAWKPGVVMRLRSGTAVTVPQDGDLQVTAGTLEATVTGQPPGSVRIQVPGATITDIGTRFAVAVDGPVTTLSVSEGVVEVQAAGTDARQVTADQMARLEAGRMTLLPLASIDLGQAAPAGRTILSGDRIILESAGADPSLQRDAGRFLYRELTGNWDAVVRIETPAPHSAIHRVGLMVRTSTDAGSPFAACLLSPDEGTRLTVRGAVGHVRAWRSRAGTDRTLPTWLKLTRRGQFFTAFQSTDGTTWKNIGGHAVTLPSAVLAGLMVNSLVDGTPVTAEFSHWTITPVP